MSQYNYNSSLGSATATAGPLFGGMVDSPIRTLVSLGLGAAGANYGGKIGEAIGGGEDTNGGDIGKMVGENIGGLAGGIAGWKYATGVTKRAVETAMRTTADPNPLSEIMENLERMWKYGEMGGRGRLGNVALRVLTGIRRGDGKGYWGSLGTWDPDGKSTFWHPGKTEWSSYNGGVGNQYHGYNGYSHENPGNVRKYDYIDAMLYNKEVDPSFGLQKVAEGEQFGPHYGYIQTNYPDKAGRIQVYQTSHQPVLGKIKGDKTPKGTDYPSDLPTEETYGEYNDASHVNVAGHYVQHGRGLAGTNNDGSAWYAPVVKHQDLYKFQPKDYITKWLEGRNTPPTWLQKMLIKEGLKITDKFTTPIITRTPWVWERNF